MSMLPTPNGGVDVLAAMRQRAQLLQQLGAQRALPPGANPVTQNIGNITHTPIQPDAVYAPGQLGAAQQMSSPLGATAGADPFLASGIGGAGEAGAGAVGAGATGAAEAAGGSFLARNFPSLLSKEAWVPESLGAGLRAFGPAVGGAALAPYAGNLANAALGSAGFDKKDSTLNRFVSGAAGGATVGAGLGLAGGPFAEVTVPAGAGIGALVGGGLDVLKGIFGGKSTPKTGLAAVTNPDTAMAFLSQVAGTAGLSPKYQQQLMQQFNTALQFSDGSKESLQQILGQSMAPAIQNLAYQQQLDNTTQSNTAGQIQRAMALQGMVGQMMQPSIDQGRAASNSNADQITSLANTVADPESRKMLLAQASQQRSNGARDAASLAGLGQALPTVQAMALDSQMANQYGQQQQAARLAALQQQYGVSAK